jgi:hypothetical protein
MVAELQTRIQENKNVPQNKFFVVDISWFEELEIFYGEQEASPWAWNFFMQASELRRERFLAKVFHFFINLKFLNFWLQKTESGSASGQELQESLDSHPDS